jgi:hypothetical protein
MSSRRTWASRLVCYPKICVTRVATTPNNATKEAVVVGACHLVGGGIGKLAGSSSKCRMLDRVVHSISRCALFFDLAINP